MFKYIFVDLENIHYIGLRGIRHLQAMCKVFIFYSDHSNTIRIETYEEIQKSLATIEFIRISSTGANALDFQLSVFLGTIAEKEHGSKLIIVSKDKAFVHVINFCETYLADYELKLSQFNSIKEIVYNERINQERQVVDVDDYLFLAK